MRMLFAVIACCLPLLAESVDQSPILVLAPKNKSKITMKWTSPSPGPFSIRVRWQDEGDAGPATSVINDCHAKSVAPMVWGSSKAKILGDTNWVSVAVQGSTNWSNEIVVIP